MAGRNREGGRVGPAGDAECRAVVVTLNCAVMPEVPETMTDGVPGAQLAAAGAPMQLKLTVWLNPPLEPSVTVKLVDCPAVTVAELDVGVIEKSPFPLPL